MGRTQAASSTGCATTIHLRAGAGSPPRGSQLRQETSFQGGDGYLYFMAPESALAVTTRILEHCMDPPAEPDDPFYVQQDYVDEFFAAVEQFNEQVIEHPCYATFLGAYGTSMLYPTGSRALRRQYDGAGARRP